jgi:phosphoribosylformylglycinamidine cyclo-ligase
MDYKTAGVDIEAGRSFVDQIKDTVKSTHRPEVMGGFGGFNGMMRIPEGYEKPVLVSGTDGVGTKIHVAELNATGNPSVMQGIGIDLVAMCVNDVITCGAKPLYFLDYICTSNLKQYGDLVKHLVDGIAEGCKQSGCSLLGGETAEHPQRLAMAHSIRDVSGFCTGIVEENEIIDGSLIRESDVIIGIESSGVHSNGFSLIREMLFKHKIKLDDMPELLNPTTIYAPVVKHLLAELPIVGMAHITGGGIPENLPRCLPDGCEARVDYDAWPMPELFSKIMLAGEIPPEEMKNVFNLGIGYCLVVPSNIVDEVQNIISIYQLRSWVIGDIIHTGK